MSFSILSLTVILQRQVNVHKVSGVRIGTNELIFARCFELPGATERQGTGIIIMRKKQALRTLAGRWL